MSAPPDRPPYGSYAAIAALFLGGIAAVATSSRRAPAGTALDFVALSAATFKASRTLSRERVASFVREPFVEGEATTGQDERPAGEGLQRALGELVTCPRCVGAWTAAGLASSQMLAPRFGRLLDVVARSRRRERLPAGGLQGPLRQGERARSSRLREIPGPFGAREFTPRDGEPAPRKFDQIRQPAACLTRICPDLPTLVCRCDHLVGKERRSNKGRRMPAQVVNEPSGRHFPETRRVRPGRDDPPRVRAEGGGGNWTEVTAQDLDELPRCCIPDACVIVPACGDDELSVGRERDRIDVGEVAREHTLGLSATAEAYHSSIDESSTPRRRDRLSHRIQRRRSSGPQAGLAEPVPAKSRLSVPAVTKIAPPLSNSRSVTEADPP